MGVNLKEQLDKAQENVRKAKDAADGVNSKVDPVADSIVSRVLGSKYTAVIVVVLIVASLVLGIYLGKHG